MFRQKRVTIAAVLATVLVATAQAESGAVQFAADMVRRGPDGQVTSGKMFVGDGRTRMEMSQQDREVIRISDQNRHMEWILFPAEQNYLERGAPPGTEGAPPPPRAALRGGRPLPRHAGGHLSPGRDGGRERPARGQVGAIRESGR